MSETLNRELIAAMLREHIGCTWLSNGVDVVWSCGITHAGAIHMQPTTRDGHVAELVMTQIEADRALATPDPSPAGGGSE